MPTYKNNHDTVLRLQTRFNPRSTVPRALEVKPGGHFIFSGALRRSHLSALS
jgi:hypothetical protein